MKALEIGKKGLKLEDLEYPMYAQIKYDGRAIMSVKQNGKIYHLTSGGKKWESYINYIPDTAPDGVYIGEFLGNGKGKLGDRRETAIERTFVTNTTKGIKNNTLYKVVYYDYIDIEDFEEGVSKSRYADRLPILTLNLDKNVVVSTAVIYDEKNVKDFFNYALSQGYEGIMLKSPNLEWDKSSKRVKGMVKMKDRKTGDFMVSKEIEGINRLKGKIGALELVDAYGRVVGKVGSGLSDEERSKWGFFKGKIVEVEYEQILNGHLIQPTFVRVRDDKDIAEEI